MGLESSVRWESSASIISTKYCSPHGPGASEYGELGAWRSGDVEVKGDEKWRGDGFVKMGNLVNGILEVEVLSVSQSVVLSFVFVYIINIICIIVSIFKYIYIYSTIIHIYIDRYLFICNLQVAGNPSFCFFLGWIQVYLLAPKVQCRHHLHHQSNSNDKCLQQHSNKSCNCRRASSDEVSHKFSNEEILLLHSMMFIIIFDFQ